MWITKQYLINHPNHIFVFGDNMSRSGYGGAAHLRDYPNTYGFVTKKLPLSIDVAYYKPEEYKAKFEKELKLLVQAIEHKDSKGKTWLISKLGAGLANKYKIWQEVIEPGLKVLERYPNVVFLWK